MTGLLTVVLAGGALLLIVLAVVLPVLLALAFVAFVVKMLVLLVLLPFRAAGWVVGAGVGALVYHLVRRHRAASPAVGRA